MLTLLYVVGLTDSLGSCSGLLPVTFVFSFVFFVFVVFCRPHLSLYFLLVRVLYSQYQSSIETYLVLSRWYRRESQSLRRAEAREAFSFR